MEITFNATADINVDHLIDELNLDDKLDYETIATETIERLDMDEIASLVTEKIDLEEIKDLVLNEIDYDRIVEEVNDGIDIKYQVEDMDFTNIAEKLLDMYDPENSCSTGRSFTEAVSSAILYMLKNEKQFNLATSIDEAILASRQEIIIEQEVAKMFERNRVELYMQHEKMFEKKLNEYAKALEEAEANKAFEKEEDTSDYLSYIKSITN